MSASDRSIAQRLSRAKAPGRRAEVAQDWARNWARNWAQDQSTALLMLERARCAQDWRGIGQAVAQLRAITDKRFGALSAVIKSLAAEGVQNE